MMNSDLKEKLESLKVLSKSGVRTYENCPHAFMLAKIAGIKSKTNKYLTLGLEVHKFHDNYFDNVFISNNKIFYTGDPHKDDPYKKNILQYHEERLNRLLQTNICSNDLNKYFFPILKEEMITLDDIMVRGIPDAIFYNMGGSVEVFEVKTGKPTPKKIQNYKEDLVWYKLLCERGTSINEKIDIGRIYFPYNNQEALHKIHDSDVEKLIVRVDCIRNDILSAKFDPLPTPNKCTWCLFNHVCEHSMT